MMRGVFVSSDVQHCNVTPCITLLNLEDMGYVLMEIKNIESN